jgi:hypothetical protein
MTLTPDTFPFMLHFFFFLTEFLHASLLITHQKLCHSNNSHTMNKGLKFEGMGIELIEVTNSRAPGL